MNGHPIPEENFDLYALGVLEGEEKQALESHVAACPTCGRELEEARERIALLALSLPPQAPPARVKAQLLQRIAGTPHQPRAVRYSAEPAKPAARWYSWSPVWASLAAACAVAATVLWLGNHRLDRQIQELRDQVAQRAAQQAQDRSILDLIAANDTANVNLTPTPDAPTGQGRVLYNPRLGLVFYTGALPVTAADKTYQLWLVPANGNPISAGIFQPGNAGASSSLTASVPVGTQAKAFAVTIEPAGGKPQPTGPKVLIGAV
jgi:anti-sigma-K factor RskA